MVEGAGRRKEKRPRNVRGLLLSTGKRLERAGPLLGHHVLVVAVVRDLLPEEALVAGGFGSVVELLEISVGSADLGIGLVGGVEARIHNLSTKRPDLHPGANQPAEGR